MRVELVLGTANLGLPYGAAIRRDLPTDQEAEAILRHARHCGFRAVDTARAYGLSEARIGGHLKIGEGFHRDEIYTKIDPLSGLDAETSPELACELAEESLARSREALNIGKLRRVLLHRASQLDDAAGAVWSYLIRERSAGGIAEIGVSVQDTKEAERALQCPDIDAVQLPCNILDWRFDGLDLSQTLERVSGPVRIEARSIFLQGVLPSGTASVFPDLPMAYDRGIIVNWLQRTADEFSGGAIDALCLRYVASLGWIDAIVVGADSVSQVERQAALAEFKPLSTDAVAAIRASRPVIPEALLNPSLWLTHGR